MKGFQEEMRKAAAYGVPIVLGTIGEDGSYALVGGKFYYASAVFAAKAAPSRMAL